MTKGNSVSIVFVAIIAAILMFVPAIMLTNPVSAQEEQQAETTSEEQPSEQTVEGSYDFVAQPGDSYSTIARKAVQIYGIESETNLSQEQIMFAETNLTIEAGSPLLTVDEKVSIQKSAVKNWVDKANELSDSQKAAWSKYTIGVNFNTDSVGE